jgi:flagellar hook assembly protein FlgD
MASIAPRYSRSTSSTRSSVAVELSQNEPNPFNPTTTIEYSVPSRTQVELSIFNVHGRRIRRLASGVRGAGRYTVSWDGRDGAGDRVAAGVYFYRLVAGAESATKKMTVVP